MKRKTLEILIGIILVLVLVASYMSYSNEGVIYDLISGNIPEVITYLQSFGALAGFVFVFIVLVEVLIAPIPSLLLYTIGGIMFGPFVGGSLALLGNVVGAFIAFSITRFYGGGVFERNMNPKSRKRFGKFFEKYGASSIFLLRINPITSTDIFSYLAGLTKMKRGHFMAGTILGLAPLVYAQTYLGDFLSKDPVLFQFFLWLSVIYILIFIIILIIHKKK